LNLPDVVHQQNPFPSHVEAVRRFVDLGSHSARGISAQCFTIAVVAPKDAEQGGAPLMKWRETERRAVISGVHHHAHALFGEFL